MDLLTFGEFSIVYNSFSFTFATMMAATLFFWLNLGSVAAAYRPALVVTGLVTFIAAYHYLQILISFGNAYDVTNGVVTATGKEFNVAYRYVDWLLTVPLLLIELILVMKLTQSETVKKATLLGGAAALMIILGYPGEIAGDMGTRQFWWALSMIPFLYIVFSLVVGLKSSITEQPDSAKGLIKIASLVVIISWSFYPIVYLFPNLGIESAYAAVEIGYSVADIIAKAGFGVLIYMIARRKSEAEGFKA
ncbi:MAG: bacteriorhodopsin [Alphaproteobacteria bacterium]|nr:bacteriorhodopsin [Alphaproteobacteria bacterium]NCQ88925.1 bacteriorhodopsin [Alphaproteobacteria bacterium]NCT07827.1 bacteriorhodopsin [Alphaproteobacteria bacterium]